jgi:hypothetical protein
LSTTDGIEKYQQMWTSVAHRYKDKGDNVRRGCGKTKMGRLSQPAHYILSTACIIRYLINDIFFI